MTIEEKYNIRYVGAKRLYKVDLYNRNYDFEFSSPYALKIGSYSKKIGSYNNLIFWEAKLLNQISPKSKEELLSIKNDWGKQKVFSTIKKSNFMKFDEGLFINVNHTSIHAIWTIQLFLNEWNIDLSTCELYIHKMPKGEKEDVIKYYESKTIDDFRTYINETHLDSKKNLDYIVSVLANINRTICPKLFENKGYNNILAIDNYSIFLTLKKEIILDLENMDYKNKNVLKNYLISLKLLDEFYKVKLVKA